MENVSLLALTGVLIIQSFHKKYVEALPTVPCMEPLEQALECHLGGSADHTAYATQIVKLSPLVHTVCGTVHLRSVDFHVIDTPIKEVLLGKPLLMSLGINLDDQFAALALHQDTVDASSNEDDLSEAYHDVTVGSIDNYALMAALDRMIDRAIAAGLDVKLKQKLTELVYSFQDIFRISLSNDPPARVAPLKVKLEPNAKPPICKPRQYCMEKQVFHKEYFAQLCEYDYVRLNSNSRYASPSHPVPKPDGTFRTTVDYRAVNAINIPLAWPMPNIETLHLWLFPTEGNDGSKRLV